MSTRGRLQESTIWQTADESGFPHWVWQYLAWWSRSRWIYHLCDRFHLAPQSDDLDLVISLSDSARSAGRSGLAIRHHHSFGSARLGIRSRRRQ